MFEAMFHGELAETRDFIELPDCEYGEYFGVVSLHVQQLSELKRK